jgi:hypothetical protein
VFRITHPIGIFRALGAYPFCAPRGERSDVQATGRLNRIGTCSQQEVVKDRRH